MWDAFVCATGTDPATPYETVAFAYEPATQDGLAALVLAGPKRATTALLHWYGPEGERFPWPGDHFIVVDSHGAAYCVCRLSLVEVRAFTDVDERYAWIEGEGDRSLAYCRGAHRRFFESEAAEGGFAFDEHSDVVLQYFDVVWPPDAAAVDVASPL